MKPILKMDFISIMFVIMLTALGISLAIFLMFDLSHREKLAMILIGISCLLTSVSFFLEILRRRRNSENH